MGSDGNIQPFFQLNNRKDFYFYNYGMKILSLLRKAIYEKDKKVGRFIYSSNHKFCSLSL